MNTLNRLFGGMILVGWAVFSTGLIAHDPGASGAPEGIIVTRHFSGLWEQTEHQNQGFTLHVVHQYSGERVAVAFWFTYGEDQESTWLMGRGPVVENRIELELYRLSGIEFLQHKNPDLNLAEVVGTALMEFDSCQTGTVSYDTNLPGMGSGSFAIEQFGWILNTHCSGGMSDDMPTDAMYGQQSLELISARQGIQGNGHVRFESYPNHMEFEVEAEGLPDGEYQLYVGMHARGEFSVHEGHGEIKFSSPGEDGRMLLNFEPRGQRIEIHDHIGVVFSSFDSMMEEDDHSPYRGGHGTGHGPADDHYYRCADDSGMRGGHGGGMHNGGDDCVEDGEYVQVEVDLDNTGVLAEARGEAEWEMNSHRVRFSVEIEDVPVGEYPLRVGGQEVGIIKTFEMRSGDVFGHLGFRDPEVYGMEHLDFDPRGQKIEVLQSETIILEVDFPVEP